MVGRELTVSLEGVDRGRLDGRAEATATPVGLVPAPGALDLTGLDLPAEDLDRLVAVDPAAWSAECDGVEDWFATFGDRLPAEMASCITSSWSGTPFETDDWLAWNLGRSQAAAARDTLPPAPSASTCTPYQTDDYRP